MATSAPIYPSPAPIPIDLFVSKKHEGLSGGEIGFADPLGNLVFRVTKNSSSRNWVVFDRLGVLLLSIYRQHNGCWHVFKGGNVVEKEMIFRVERTLNKFFKPELEAFFVRENSGESTSNFKVKGCPFQRSCVIYGGDTIVAEVLLLTTMVASEYGCKRAELSSTMLDLKLDKLGNFRLKFNSKNFEFGLGLNFTETFELFRAGSARLLRYH